MKKNLYLLFFIFCVTCSAHAQSIKNFSLKDGSTIKREIASFENNIYKVKTANLGQIEIPDSKVLTISSGDIPVSQNLQAPSLNNNSAISAQVGQLQNSILSDPATMSQIENLVADPQIQTILKDPTFLNDIMCMDPTKIENNAKTQQLLENPRFKQLIDQIKQKVDPQK